MTRTSRKHHGRWRLFVAASLFALVAALLAATGPVAATQSGAGGETASSDPLVALSEHVSPRTTW
jgi:hypothetical protein